jgi:hypothetical protein
VLESPVAVGELGIHQEDTHARPRIGRIDGDGGDQLEPVLPLAYSHRLQRGGWRLVITHSEGTIESPKTLFSVSMEMPGESKLVTVDLVA